MGDRLRLRTLGLGCAAMSDPPSQTAAMSDPPSQTADRGTFRLMYRSRDLLPVEDREEELADLFATSRSNNQTREVTGALLVSDTWFVQVLEGPEAEVRSLYALIEQDPRHDQVEVLYAGRALERVFGHWSMAAVSMSEADLPLIARISEISPASSRAMTPAKQQLLTAMRDAMEEPPSPLASA